MPLGSRAANAAASDEPERAAMRRLIRTCALDPGRNFGTREHPQVMKPSYRGPAPRTAATAAQPESSRRRPAPPTGGGPPPEADGEPGSVDSDQPMPSSPQRPSLAELHWSRKPVQDKAFPLVPAGSTHPTYLVED